jgi:predicted nucleic acid-binding protein
MQAVLLDTDVFSFIHKADSRALRYEADVLGKEICLCFQTVAELRLWVMEKDWGLARRERLVAAMRRCVILPYDAEMAEQWANVTSRRRRVGRPINCGDAWIAAAAIRHDVHLITHNAQDYFDIPGLTIITHPDSGA